jgi:ribosomal protein L37E
METEVLVKTALCTRCGKEPQKTNHTFCPACFNAASKESRRRWAKRVQRHREWIQRAEQARQAGSLDLALVLVTEVLEATAPRGA